MSDILKTIGNTPIVKLKNIKLVIKNLIRNFLIIYFSKILNIFNSVIEK